jgi:hypothetical protein
LNEANPRLIDDNKARDLCNELKKCPYYETCATYGLNVERVFHDACQKVVNLRTQMLTAMANIATVSSFTRPITHQQQQAQSQSTSSIRMLAGSHLSTTSTNLSSASTIIASTIQQNGYSGSASIPTSNGTSTSLLSPNSLANSLGFFQANPHLIVPAAYHSTLANNNAAQSAQPQTQQQAQISVHSQSSSAISTNQTHLSNSVGVKFSIKIYLF